MNFSKFILILLFCYIFYYLLNIIYDLFLKRNKKEGVESEDVYEFNSLSSDENEPVHVEGFEPDGEKKSENLIPSKQLVNVNEDEPVILNEVENQGIPFEKFMKQSQVMFNF